MTNAKARAELERLIAILGPLWEREADPAIAVASGGVDLWIPACRGPLLRRLALVDRAAKWLDSHAVPVQGPHPCSPGDDWGQYTTAVGAGLNGVEICVWTPLSVEEMGGDLVQVAS